MQNVRALSSAELTLCIGTKHCSYRLSGAHTREAPPPPAWVVMRIPRNQQANHAIRKQAMFHYSATISPFFTFTGLNELRQYPTSYKPGPLFSYNLTFLNFWRVCHATQLHHLANCKAARGHLSSTGRLGGTKGCTRSLHPASCKGIMIYSDN